MIIKKDFYHQGLKYSFNWQMSRLEPFKDESRVNRDLYNYLKNITEKKIPHRIFNDRNCQRISQFHFKGLKRGMLKKQAIRLAQLDLIRIRRVNNSNLELSDMAAKVYENWASCGIKGKPGHEPILKYALINHPSAIAIETPIWHLNPDISGHIDLILKIDDYLYIVDYKPERNYLKSLPQVAFYGLLAKRRFRTTKIRCVQFSKEDSWEYDPEIIVAHLPQLFKKEKYHQFPWVPLLPRI